MNELALCAGAGGGILGAQLLGHRTVAAVEIDPYRREVLLRRQCDGVLPVFPIWDDLRTFDGGQWRGVVDCVTAGFPCPPFSVAGKGLAGDDPRNLWPDVARILGEVGPDFALLENVAGLLTHGYTGRILGDLAALGMDALWDCVPASAVGAPHRRDRIWILGYARAGRCGGESRRGARAVAPHRHIELEEGVNPHPTRDAERPRFGIVDGCQRARGSADGADGEEVAAVVSDANKGRREPSDSRERGLSVIDASSADAGDADRSPTDPYTAPSASRRAAGESSWWVSEPDVGRVANGVACRVDRLSALGDGQVPAVVVRAWRELRANL